MENLKPQPDQIEKLFKGIQELQDDYKNQLDEHVKLIEKLNKVFNFVADNMNNNFASAKKLSSLVNTDGCEKLELKEFMKLIKESAEFGISEKIFDLIK
jgi:16S rRNA G527 N7-methylase RsmG